MTGTIDETIVEIQNQLGIIKQDEKSPSGFYLRTPDMKEHILLGYCIVDKRTKIENKQEQKSLKLLDLTEIKNEKDLEDFRINVEHGQIHLMYLPQETTKSYDEVKQETIPQIKKDTNYFVQQIREKNIAITEAVKKTYR